MLSPFVSGPTPSPGDGRKSPPWDALRLDLDVDRPVGSDRSSAIYSGMTVSLLSVFHSRRHAAPKRRRRGLRAIASMSSWSTTR